MQTFIETIIIFIHMILVIPTIYLILFNNNPILISTLSAILFIVSLQVHLCGCILNKYENNSSINILKRAFHIPNVSDDDLTKILVYGTFLTCLTKLLIILLLPSIVNLHL